MLLDFEYLLPLLCANTSCTSSRELRVAVGAVARDHIHRDNIYYIY